MKIISPSYEILRFDDADTILRLIEIAGRTCYKSEDMITPDSSRAFAGRILDMGHLSVIEHAGATVRFICDRGVTHELVRHRLASYSQESTRYANYSRNKFGNEITVIKPLFWAEDSLEYKCWHAAMLAAETAYMELIRMGARPQEARSVLPNSLKTEIVVTCNMREWRHIFFLRCDKPAHPQIREIMLPLLKEFHDKVPELFNDLYKRFFCD